ncbi:MAG: hypothetical protein OEW45_23530, partial [Deltaproteobacteria bacterium]|nr:hypothetical protein [Deltaproteobacteria bacterium]
YMDEAEYCDRLALIDQGKIIALGTPAELKTRYMPESVWELETDHLHEALGVLQEDAGVTGQPPARGPESSLTEVAVFGNTLHLVTRREEDPSTYIPALLAARGIATKRLVQIEPSLEDVFVYLIEAKDRQVSKLSLSSQP